MSLSLERGEGNEKKGRDTLMHSCTPPTWDLAHNPGMCLDWELTQRPFDSQAGAQSTEPHQPGLNLHFR